MKLEPSIVTLMQDHYKSTGCQESREILEHLESNSSIMSLDQVSKYFDKICPVCCHPIGSDALKIIFDCGHIHHAACYDRLVVSHPEPSCTACDQQLKQSHVLVKVKIPFLRRLFHGSKRALFTRLLQKKIHKRLPSSMKIRFEVIRMQNSHYYLKFFSVDLNAFSEQGVFKKNYSPVFFHRGEIWVLIPSEIFILLC